MFYTHNISSDSKWPGTIYKFFIIFQDLSLKKIKWQRFFYMKILKKYSQRKIAYWKNSPFVNPRRNSEKIGNSHILKVNQQNVNPTGSAILSPILFKLSERSVCLCSTDMGKYTLNLTRNSSNHVLLTYSIVFIINV